MTLQDYIVRYAIFFLVASTVTLLIEPLIMWWARRYTIVDKPDWRKVHQDSIAGAGGLVFLPTLILCFILALYLWPVFWREKYLGLVLAAFIITLCGLWDDIFGMRAVPKLFCQIFSGSILFFSGYRFTNISVPFARKVIDLGMMDYFLTILAIAAIINAINMIFYL